MPDLLKRSQLEIELSNPMLSEKDRVKVLHRLYKLDNKADFGLKLIMLVTFVALGFATYVITQ